MRLTNYLDTSGELVFLAAAELSVRGQPIVSGTLESCLENWTLLPAEARSVASITVIRPIRIHDQMIRQLPADVIADVARRYRITAPRKRSIDRSGPADPVETEAGQTGI